LSIRDEHQLKAFAGVTELQSQVGKSAKQINSYKIKPWALN
jgi:hypothetical protein